MKVRLRIVRGGANQTCWKRIFSQVWVLTQFPGAQTSFNRSRKTETDWKSPAARQIPISAVTKHSLINDRRGWLLISYSGWHLGSASRYEALVMPAGARQGSEHSQWAAAGSSTWGRVAYGLQTTNAVKDSQCFWLPSCNLIYIFNRYSHIYHYIRKHIAEYQKIHINGNA